MRSRSFKKLSTQGKLKFDEQTLPTYNPAESGSWSFRRFRASFTELSSHSAFISSLHCAIVTVALSCFEPVTAFRCPSPGSKTSFHDLTVNSESFRFVFCVSSSPSKGVATMGPADCNGWNPEPNRCFSSLSTPRSGASRIIRRWWRSVNLIGSSSFWRGWSSSESAGTSPFMSACTTSSIVAIVRTTLSCTTARQLCRSLSHSGRAYCIRKSVK